MTSMSVLSSVRRCSLQDCGLALPSICRLYGLRRSRIARSRNRYTAYACDQVRMNGVLNDAIDGREFFAKLHNIDCTICIVSSAFSSSLMARFNGCQASLRKPFDAILIGTNQIHGTPMSPTNFGSNLQNGCLQHVAPSMRQLSSDAAIDL